MAGTFSDVRSLFFAAYSDFGENLLDCKDYATVACSWTRSSFYQNRSLELKTQKDPT